MVTPRKSLRVKRDADRQRHALCSIVDSMIEIVNANSSASGILVTEPFEKRIKCKDDGLDNGSLSTAIIANKQVDARREVDVIMLKASKVFKMYMLQHRNSLL